jgi:hypothetical protein
MKAFSLEEAFFILKKWLLKKNGIKPECCGQIKNIIPL